MSQTVTRRNASTRRGVPSRASSKVLALAAKLLAKAFAAPARDSLESARDASQTSKRAAPTSLDVYRERVGHMPTNDKELHTLASLLVSGPPPYVPGVGRRV